MSCPLVSSFLSRSFISSTPLARGSLFLVSTPIGHLHDLSLRAIDTLSRTSLLACESSSLARRLLHAIESRFSSISLVSSPLQPNSDEHVSRDSSQKRRFLHLTDHVGRSQSSNIEVILRHLDSGEDVAYISDAGTPGISDPCARLVSECHERGIRVVPIPGPSALAVALSVCGFFYETSTFVGFFPRTRSQIVAALQKWCFLPGNIVVGFESPNRVEALFEALSSTLPKHRRVCVIREATKIHETILTVPLFMLRLSSISENSQSDLVEKARGEDGYW